MTTHPIEITARRQPIYWFALLESAVLCGDHVAAAEAQRELERLGVIVRYGHRYDTCADEVEATHATR